MNVVFSEIRSIFPDEYIHLGGNEVDTACWESNLQIQSYLTVNGLDSSDLSYMYLERFSGDIERLGWKQIVAQEVSFIGYFTMQQQNFLNYRAKAKIFGWIGLRESLVM